MRISLRVQLVNPKEGFDMEHGFTIVLKDSTGTGMI